MKNSLPPGCIPAIMQECNRVAFFWIRHTKSLRDGRILWKRPLALLRRQDDFAHAESLRDGRILSIKNQKPVPRFDKKGKALWSILIAVTWQVFSFFHILQQ
ncbi:MAG: hypothetical protein LUI14_01375 [Lachnospiraceae bacterium]|nr:hypothetical protein [Lachnospiraceae bacterium]